MILDGQQLIHGDCLEVMKDFPDESIDMIMTDPPYGINFKSSWQTHQKFILNDDFESWQNLLNPMFIEFKRILKPEGVCCCCCGGGGKTPVTAIFTLESIKYFELIQTLVWVKTVGVGWRYRPAYENIIVLAKDRDNYNFFDTSANCKNVIDNINQVIPQKGEHPTVKPVDLMMKIIKIHTKEGMTVLDPFAGSFTTGVACNQLNRKFIGIEKELEYFNIGVERMKANRNLFLEVK